MNDSDHQKLVDRDAISFLLNEYCRALDAMDLDAVAAIFTEDCVVEYGPEDRLKSYGRQAIRTGLERLWRWARTSHHLSNIQITFVSDDEAAASSYIIAWHERPDGGTATVYGQYQDTFVRTREGWKLARRRQSKNGNDAGFTVNLFPSYRKPPPEGWVAPIIDTPLPKA